MAEKVDAKAVKVPKDAVHQDRNWTIRVNNELDAQQKWNDQWGYYGKGNFALNQDFLLKKCRQSRKNRSMIVLISWKTRSGKQMERCFKQALLPMEKATMSSCIKILNTTFMKTGSYGHCNVDYPRAGRSPSGLPVLCFSFSCRPL